MTMKWRRGALVGAEVEHLDDVRVHEPRGGERLAPEARDEARVLGEVLGEQLDGDVALEPRVERELHGRHAADAEAALEPVAVGEELRRWPSASRRRGRRRRRGVAVAPSGVGVGVGRRSASAVARRRRCVAVGVGGLGRRRASRSCVGVGVVVAVGVGVASLGLAVVRDRLSIWSTQSLQVRPAAGGRPSRGSSSISRSAQRRALLARLGAVAASSQAVCDLVGGRPGSAVRVVRGDQSSGSSVRSRPAARRRPARAARSGRRRIDRRAG